METKIQYNETLITVQGYIEYADESVGIMSDYYVCEKIILNDIDIYDDFDYEEIEDIEELSLENIENENQSSWEAANV